MEQGQRVRMKRDDNINFSRYIKIEKWRELSCVQVSKERMVGRFGRSL
jgi:hypothetical protein